MRGLALFLAGELAVAPPDGALVFVGGMPDLGTEVTTTVPADQPGGKYAVAAVAAPNSFPALQLTLHQLPLSRVNDGRVAVLHIILRHLALVFLLFLGEKIHRERLLQEGVTLVLLVFQDALHRARRPSFLPCGGGYPFLGEKARNGTGGLAAEEQTVNPADSLRFLRHDFRKSVRALPVAQKVAVRQADLPIGESFSLAPGDVLRNGAAFLLRQGGHNGNQQFPLAVQGVDVLLLEVDLHAFFLQFADGHQAVHRVPGKPADRFGHDEVDFSVQGIPYHLVETFALFGVHR